ncbi:Casein kinase I [Tritrichomonas foetus]|uniref:non-specific serine/threonine protein kinase n=1 Tax=Tritrichomonas foetus TaxID=1144522 RepID=A0A1J4L295_9EUKA|nr:Casein kinase I [Tritrichomonas foetus]|eukprot:OHT17538.1 Casein kinase I [Tritrichomonas foetus]
MNKKKKPKELKKGFVISHYRLERKIGRGGYGYIYIASDLDSENTFYAMKIEKINPEKRGLQPEIEFMPTMQGSPYFPKFYGSGENGIFRWILYEILGPSLTIIRWSLKGEHFSKYTAFRAAKEMVRALQECHNRGIIHRDVKPGNFLIRPSREHPIVLIDFGLSRPFKTPDGEFIPPRDKIGFYGTSRYASVSVYKGNEQCRGDDLISWFYSLIEMIRGDLPFPNTRDKEVLRKVKQKLTIQKLCKKLPSQLIEIWNLIKDLTYYDDPDYDRICELLDEAAASVHHQNPEYDWLRISKRKMKKISAINIFEDSEESENITVYHKLKGIPQTGTCNIA